MADKLGVPAMSAHSVAKQKPQPIGPGLSPRGSRRAIGAALGFERTAPLNFRRRMHKLPVNYAVECTIKK
jgi:hypothetical protein